MDFLVVQPAVEFSEHFLPVGLPRAKRAAIAHLIPPDDQDTGVWPTALDLGYRAHEDVKSAVRFEIARDISDDLVLCRQAQIAPLQVQPGIGIGPDHLRIYALMQHGDPGSHLWGIEALLPARRG